jgi:hypothetical protein
MNEKIIEKIIGTDRVDLKVCKAVKFLLRERRLRMMTRSFTVVDESK